MPSIFEKNIDADKKSATCGNNNNNNINPYQIDPTSMDSIGGPTMSTASSTSGNVSMTSSGASSFQDPIKKLPNDYLYTYNNDNDYDWAAAKEASVGELSMERLRLQRNRHANRGVKEPTSQEAPYVIHPTALLNKQKAVKNPTTLMSFNSESSITGSNIRSNSSSSVVNDSPAPSHLIGCNQATNGSNSSSSIGSSFQNNEEPAAPTNTVFTSDRSSAIRKCIHAGQRISLTPSQQMFQAGEMAENDLSNTSRCTSMSNDDQNEICMDVDGDDMDAELEQDQVVSSESSDYYTNSSTSNPAVTTQPPANAQKQWTPAGSSSYSYSKNKSSNTGVVPKGSSPCGQASSSGTYSNSSQKHHHFRYNRRRHRSKTPPPDFSLMEAVDKYDNEAEDESMDKSTSQPNNTDNEAALGSSSYTYIRQTETSYESIKSQVKSCLKSQTMRLDSSLPKAAGSIEHDLFRSVDALNSNNKNSIDLDLYDYLCRKRFINYKYNQPIPAEPLLTQQIMSIWDTGCRFQNQGSARPPKQAHSARTSSGNRFSAFINEISNKNSQQASAFNYSNQFSSSKRKWNLFASNEILSKDFFDRSVDNLHTLCSAGGGSISQKSRARRGGGGAGFNDNDSDLSLSRRTHPLNLSSASLSSVGSAPTTKQVPPTSTDPINYHNFLTEKPDFPIFRFLSKNLINSLFLRANNKRAQRHQQRQPATVETSSASSISTTTSFYQSKSGRAEGDSACYESADSTSKDYDNYFNQRERRIANDEQQSSSRSNSEAAAAAATTSTCADSGKLVNNQYKSSTIIHINNTQTTINKAKPNQKNLAEPSCYTTTFTTREDCDCVDDDNRKQTRVDHHRLESNVVVDADAAASSREIAAKNDSILELKKRINNAAKNNMNADVNSGSGSEIDKCIIQNFFSSRRMEGNLLERIEKQQQMHQSNVLVSVVGKRAEEPDEQEQEACEGERNARALFERQDSASPLKRSTSASACPASYYEPGLSAADAVSSRVCNEAGAAESLKSASQAGGSSAAINNSGAKSTSTCSIRLSSSIGSNNNLIKTLISDISNLKNKDNAAKFSSAYSKQQLEEKRLKLATPATVITTSSIEMSVVGPSRANAAATAVAESSPSDICMSKVFANSVNNSNNSNNANKPTRDNQEQLEQIERDLEKDEFSSRLKAFKFLNEALLNSSKCQADLPTTTTTTTTTTTAPTLTSKQSTTHELTKTTTTTNKSQNDVDDESRDDCDDGLTKRRQEPAPQQLDTSSSSNSTSTTSSERDSKLLRDSNKMQTLIAGGNGSLLSSSSSSSSTSSLPNTSSSRATAGSTSSATTTTKVFEIDEYDKQKTTPTNKLNSSELSETRRKSETPTTTTMTTTNERIDTITCKKISEDDDVTRTTNKSDITRRSGSSDVNDDNAAAVDDEEDDKSKRNSNDNQKDFENNDEANYQAKASAIAANKNSNYSTTTTNKFMPIYSSTDGNNTIKTMSLDRPTTTTTTTTTTRTTLATSTTCLDNSRRSGSGRAITNEESSELENDVDDEEEPASRVGLGGVDLCTHSNRTNSTLLNLINMDGQINDEISGKKPCEINDEDASHSNSSTMSKCRPINNDTINASELTHSLTPPPPPPPTLPPSRSPLTQQSKSTTTKTTTLHQLIDDCTNEQKQIQFERATRVDQLIMMRNEEEAEKERGAANAVVVVVGPVETRLESNLGPSAALHHDSSSSINNPESVSLGGVSCSLTEQAIRKQSTLESINKEEADLNLNSFSKANEICSELQQNKYGRVDDNDNAVDENRSARRMHTCKQSTRDGEAERPPTTSSDDLDVVVVVGGVATRGVGGGQSKVFEEFGQSIRSAEAEKKEVVVANNAATINNNNNEEDDEAKPNIERDDTNTAIHHSQNSNDKHKLKTNEENVNDEAKKEEEEAGEKSDDGEEKEKEKEKEYKKNSIKNHQTHSRRPPNVNGPGEEEVIIKEEKKKKNIEKKVISLVDEFDKKLEIIESNLKLNPTLLSPAREQHDEVRSSGVIQVDKSCDDDDGQLPTTKVTTTTKTTSTTNTNQKASREEEEEDYEKARANLSLHEADETNAKASELEEHSLNAKHLLLLNNTNSDTNLKNDQEMMNDRRTNIFTTSKYSRQQLEQPERALVQSKEKNEQDSEKQLAAQSSSSSHRQPYSSSSSSSNAAAKSNANTPNASRQQKDDSSSCVVSSSSLSSFSSSSFEGKSFPTSKYQQQQQQQPPSSTSARILPDLTTTTTTNPSASKNKNAESDNTNKSSALESDHAANLISSSCNQHHQHHHLNHKPDASTNESCRQPLVVLPESQASSTSTLFTNTLKKLNERITMAHESTNESSSSILSGNLKCQEFVSGLAESSPETEQPSSDAYVAVRAKLAADSLADDPLFDINSNRDSLDSQSGSELNIIVMSRKVFLAARQSGDSLENEQVVTKPIDEASVPDAITSTEFTKVTNPKAATVADLNETTNDDSTCVTLVQTDDSFVKANKNDFDINASPAEEEKKRRLVKNVPRDTRAQYTSSLADPNESKDLAAENDENDDDAASIKSNKSFSELSSITHHNENEMSFASSKFDLPNVTMTDGGVTSERNSLIDTTSRGYQPSSSHESVTSLSLDGSTASSKIRKVVLKNKEVVLIEECNDDDYDDDESSRVDRSSHSPVNLFPEPAAPTATPMARPAYKSKSFYNSRTSTLNKEAATSHGSGDSSDDPYVKAALERFDAFCKSKSTYSLDKSVSSTPSATEAPTKATEKPTPIATSTLNRQKSPYLSKKTLQQQAAPEDPAAKEQLGSFIKRRQARIEPHAKKLPSSVSARSTSEVRPSASSYSHDEAAKTSEANLLNVGPSSLAKKFLGTLSSSTTASPEPANEEPTVQKTTRQSRTDSVAKTTPQQSAVPRATPAATKKPSEAPKKEAAAAKTAPEEAKAASPTASSSLTSISTNASAPDAQMPEQPQPSSLKRSSPLKSSTSQSTSITAQRSQSLKQEASPIKSSSSSLTSSSPVCSTSSSNDASKPITLANSDHSASPPTSSLKDSREEKSTAGSDSNGKTTKPHVNIIKLEVVNSANKVKRSSAEDQQIQQSKSLNAAKTNEKPPLPPASTSTVANPASNSSGSWRSKLKSIYSEEPIIDGTHSSHPSSVQVISEPSSEPTTKNPTTPTKTSASSASSKSGTPPKEEKPTKAESTSSGKPTRPGVRMIPLEVKNSKTAATTTTAKPPNPKKTKASSLKVKVEKNKDSDQSNEQSNQSVSSSSSSDELQPSQTSPSTSISIPLSSYDRLQSKTSAFGESTDATQNMSPYSRSSSVPYGSSTHSYESFRTPAGSDYRSYLPSARMNSYGQYNFDTSRAENSDETVHDISTGSEIRNQSHDPVVEKACSNFMYRLMEFQRQQGKSYLSSPLTSLASTPTGSLSSATGAAHLPALNSALTHSETLSSTSAYSAPFVSARTSNNITVGGPTFSSFYDKPASYPYASSSYVSQAPATSSLGAYSFGSGSVYEPPSLQSKYAPAATTPTMTPLSSAASTLDRNASIGGATSDRPYVSSIRKRRTLFSDDYLAPVVNDPAPVVSYPYPSSSSLSTSSSTGKDFYTSYLNKAPAPTSFTAPPPNTTPLTNTYTSEPNSVASTLTGGLGFSHARNRPLSIVSEETNGLGSAFTRKLVEEEASNNSELNRKHLNNSSESNDGNDASESENTVASSAKASSAAKPAKAPKSTAKAAAKPATTAQTKSSLSGSKTNVFERLTSTSTASNTTGGTNSSSSIASKSKTSLSKNGSLWQLNTDSSSGCLMSDEQATPGLVNPGRRMSADNSKYSSGYSSFLANDSTSMLGDNVTIKAQNEIAIVTSMMQKNRDHYLSNGTTSAPTGGAANGSALSRMRSLDSKGREKLRSNLSLLSQTNSPSCSSGKENTVQRNPNAPIVPACYLYATSPTQPAQPTSAPPAKSAPAKSAKPGSPTSPTSTPLPGEVTTASTPSAIKKRSSTQSGAKTNTSEVPSPPGSTNSSSSSRKCVFERLSKRTNSMKNLNTSSNQPKLSSPKSIGSTNSSDADHAACSSSSSSSSHDEAMAHEDEYYNDAAAAAAETRIDASHPSKQSSSSIQMTTSQHVNTHAISKTSVFERLYKSNIAAHMNQANASSVSPSQHNDISSGSSKSSMASNIDQIHHQASPTSSTSSATIGLKKNMSVSSASLSSANPAQLLHTVGNNAASSTLASSSTSSTASSSNSANRIQNNRRLFSRASLPKNSSLAIETSNSKLGGMYPASKSNASNSPTESSEKSLLSDREFTESAEYDPLRSRFGVELEPKAASSASSSGSSPQHSDSENPPKPISRKNSMSKRTIAVSSPKPTTAQETTPSGKTGAVQSPPTSSFLTHKLMDLLKQ